MIGSRFGSRSAETDGLNIRFLKWLTWKDSITTCISDYDFAFIRTMYNTRCTPNSHPGIMYAGIVISENIISIDNNIHASEHLVRFFFQMRSSLVSSPYIMCSYFNHSIFSNLNWSAHATH